jgi:hypothetical protein
VVSDVGRRTPDKADGPAGRDPNRAVRLCDVGQSAGPSPRVTVTEWLAPEESV